MSDTPMTDRRVIRQDPRMCGCCYKSEITYADFARRLERELAEVKNDLDFRRDLYKLQEMQLAEIAEQRDGLRAGIDYASDQLTKVKEQRDRLAEALRKAISWADSASHHILHRQNINWTYLNEAKETLNLWEE